MRVSAMLSGALVVLSLLAFGCASATVGTPMDSAKIQTIKKGVTTEAEIETDFGKSDSVSMLPDGRREVDYVYAKSDAKPEADMWIPIWDLFSAHEDVTTYTQHLQIYLKKDIVDDYQYSDKSNSIRSSSGILSGNSSSSTQPSGS
jgi:hypothetical protein